MGQVILSILLHILLQIALQFDPDQVPGHPPYRQKVARSHQTVYHIRLINLWLGIINCKLKF